jgi:hypothetical protein
MMNAPDTWYAQVTICAPLTQIDPQYIISCEGFGNDEQPIFFRVHGIPK